MTSSDKYIYKNLFLKKHVWHSEKAFVDLNLKNKQELKLIVKLTTMWEVCDSFDLSQVLVVLIEQRPTFFSLLFPCFIIINSCMTLSKVQLAKRIGSFMFSKHRVLLNNNTLQFHRIRGVATLPKPVHEVSRKSTEYLFKQ
jgi:hypothetical protein